MAADGSTKSVEDLRADLDQLKADMSTLMETLGKVASDGTQEGVRRVREARERVGAQAEQSMHAVEAQIAERPFISILAAFGLGMVIGRLLDRR